MPKITLSSDLNSREKSCMIYHDNFSFCKDFFGEKRNQGSFQYRKQPLWWLIVHPPHEQEVVGFILGRDRPKSLKLVVEAFPLGAQDYRNITTTGPPMSG